MLHRIAAGLAVLAVTTVVVFATPLSAAADAKTTITFTGETAVTADYGSDWVLSVAAKVTYDGVKLPVHARDGSIDVFVDGVGGTFAKDLAIQPDGSAYISQPDDQPLLAPGTYAVRATFTASEDSYMKNSQTSQMATLTIAPIGVEPTVVVEPTGEHPIITATLGGAYVQKYGGAPPGTWSFDVADAAGTSVFAIDVAQQSGSTDPTVIEITTELDAGANYTVSSTFTPAGDWVTGLQVATIPAVPLATPDGTFADSIGLPVAVPVWVLIVLILLAAGLATVTIVFGGRLSSLRPRLVGPDGPDQDVDVMSVDETAELFAAADAPDTTGPQQPGDEHVTKE